MCPTMWRDMRLWHKVSAMSSPGGRHRRLGPAKWVLALAVPVVFVTGFMSGVTAERLTQPDSAAAATAPAEPSTTASTTASPTVSPTAPPAIGSSSSALPDPSNAAAGPEADYLAALEAARVPVGANRDVVLAVGRGVCAGQPEVRDPAAVAAQITGVFGDVWTPEHATRIVQAAQDELC